MRREKNEYSRDNQNHEEDENNVHFPIYNMPSKKKSLLSLPDQQSTVIEAVPVTSTKKKRQHRWTEANRIAFYEKCVPARKLSLLKRKEEKERQKAAVVPENELPKETPGLSEIPSDHQVSDQ